ncbi:MAG: hypothetical protein A2Z72_03200 [Omnitrophica bacterium RBG_13_46_9]|nr:MAG: hypothetical protein A2Z72_03200 [Omnitrophica bacterium RBG_13_46_9]
MRRFFNWQVMLGLILIVLSASVYFIHYLIFRDAHHIFLYLIGDIAFVFLEVLLVTLVLHQLLHHREKRAMLNKLNMVIGAFFIEVGTELLKAFSAFDKGASGITQKLVITNAWSEKEFSRILRNVKKHDYNIDSKGKKLEDIKGFLKEKRQFLLNLLENPNLLEHESFTNLLWAVFHLTEELVHRRKLSELPDTDYQHLSGDMKRVYTLLIAEWLNYMKHLKYNYPYLFSLALRTNPFDANAAIEVK